MDFALSAEQRELTGAAAAFARRELNQDLVKHEDAGEFPREAWRKCAEFGVQGLPVPAERGGADADILTTALVMEALGYGCHDNGLLFSLNAQMWSVEVPLVTFGTPAQQQAYLPGMVSGDLIGAHGMTEAGSGSDALHMRTRAERHGDHYVLEGTKQYITNAPVADVLLVYAVDAGRPGLFGISAFLVDAATPGLTVSSSFEKMGLRTSPMGEITLHDCIVPAGSRLGRKGRVCRSSTRPWSGNEAAFLPAPWARCGGSSRRAWSMHGHANSSASPSGSSRVCPTSWPTCTCGWRRPGR